MTPEVIESLNKKELVALLLAQMEQNAVLIARTQAAVH
jgi:hypothetical protein